METTSIEEYRLFHKQRLAAKKEVIEQKRQRILTHIQKAAEILRILGAKKMMVYGSILQAQSFHQKSDLDLIAFGLPVLKWTAAYLQLENIKEFEEIEIDLKVKFENRIYLIEFKVTDLPGRALEQIKAKAYHEKFVGQQTILIGVEFDKKTRNICRFEWEEV